MGSGAGSIGMGAGTGAISGALYGSAAGPWGTLIGAIIGGAVGAGVAAIGVSLGRPPNQQVHHSPDIIETSTTMATPVAIAFGRNRAGGNVMAVGYFFRQGNPISNQGNMIFRANYILGICEGGPPPIFQGIAATTGTPPRWIVLPSLRGANYYPFGNIRIDGQLPIDLATQWEVSAAHFWQYAYYPGTNVQQIPSFVADPQRGYNMLPRVPWRNTALLECYFLGGTTPRIPDVNIDFVAPDWTIRRNGTTDESNLNDEAIYAFYDSYTESFYYTLFASSMEGPWGIVGVGREGTPTRYHVPPPDGVEENVTLAWYLGRHDVLVMQDPSDSSTFHIGYWGISPSSTDWETHQPDPGYANAISRWHLDEVHGILHTYHANGSSPGYILRWWLLTGRIERTNTAVTDTSLVGFIYSADLNCYVIMGESGMQFIDCTTGQTFLTSVALASEGVLGLCVSGTMVGTITTSGCNYFDPFYASTLGPYGSNASDTNAGHFGGIWSAHQNTFSGQVTIPKTGSDGGIALINFIPSVVEDIRDLDANGTSNLGQDPLNDAVNNGNPEPDFQVFVFDPIAGWVRDWSVRQSNVWYLNSLEGTGSVAAAAWLVNVDEPWTDAQRFGAGMDPRYFNLGSFEGLHWYCVGSVQMANADGTYRAAERYKFEMMLTAETSVAQFLSDRILVCCQGYRTVISGQMHVGVVKSGQWPLWNFNDRNIEQKTGMTVNFISRTQGVNRVRVEYRDILTEYRHTFAQAQDNWDIQIRGRVQQATVEAEGCGRYGQAYILANSIIDQTRGSRRQTTHKSHFVGWLFTTTDPVEISHSQSGVTRMPARVIEIKEEDDIIEFTCLEQIGPVDACGIGIGSYAPNQNQGSGPGDGDIGTSNIQVTAPLDGSTVWANGGAQYPAGAYEITYLYGTWRPVTGTSDSNAPISTWLNDVAGYNVVTRNDAGTITIICAAPGIALSPPNGPPGWPTPDDAQAANQDQVLQFTLAADGPIGVALPTGTQALAGVGYTQDATPSAPIYIIAPIPAIGVPAGQPDPTGLPGTLSVGGGYGTMACPGAPTYSGSGWGGTLTNESGYLLFYFFSLDPGNKTTFGNQSLYTGPPIVLPGLTIPSTPATGTMWLEQVILFWSTTLSTGGSGWVIRFYAGNNSTIPQSSHGNEPGSPGNPNPTANTGAVGDAILVWEGELSGETVTGTYTRTAASLSPNPASIAVS